MERGGLALFGRFIAIIIATEFGAELLIPPLFGMEPENIFKTFVDTALLSLIGSVLAYFFIYRPATENIRRTRRAESESQLAEERLMALINAMPDAVYFKDGDGRWLVVNDAGLKLFDLENNGYRGKRDSELAPPDNFHHPALRHCEETDKKAWEDEGPIRVEEKIPQPDGRLLHFDVIKTPLFHPDGTRKGLVILGRDITREKSLKNARDYFAAVTSHEMLTPLTKLRLVKTLVANPGSGPDAPARLGEVAKCVQEGYDEFSRIADTTSLLAALSAPSPPETFKAFLIHLHALRAINKTIEGIEHEKRAVRLAMDMDGLAHDARVHGNPAIVEAALREVLSNAVKYTPNGGTVTVKGFTKEKEAVIAIADQGTGIPAEKIQAAFEPFFSLENPLNHSTGQYKFRGGGLGIGLTIALMALRHHGGAITLESGGEGGGTVATLRFPLA
ncbi:MAG: PAS domain-containing protein [Nitrospinae bacterium]|nr:PAS domain-containing protein [Nitrospinota bacterium]